MTGFMSIGLDNLKEQEVTLTTESTCYMIALNQLLFRYGKVMIMTDQDQDGSHIKVMDE